MINVFQKFGCEEKYRDKVVVGWGSGVMGFSFLQD